MRQHIRSRLVTTLLLATSFLTQACASGRECSPASPNVLATPLCTILKSPSQYDGRQVVVEATYRAGFEASELYCLSCNDRGGVWVDFDGPDGSDNVTKAIDRLLRKHRGTVNGTFSGVFHFQEGHKYGHLNSWSYQISLDSAQDLRLVDHLGLSPRALSSESRSKVCQ